MHFATPLVLSLLPLTAVAAAVPQEDTSMIAETFETLSGEKRTVHYSSALAKRKGGKAKAGPTPSHGGKMPYHAPSHAFASRNDPQDKCGDSTFKNKSGEGAPDAGDCQCVVEWLRANNGLWQVDAVGEGYATLVTCRTCAFGANTNNFFGGLVGNTDAADIVQDAIGKFGSEGMLAAEGDMGCWSIFETARVDWAIYTTPPKEE